MIASKPEMEMKLEKTKGNKRKRTRGRQRQQQQQQQQPRPEAKFNYYHYKTEKARSKRFKKMNWMETEFEKSAHVKCVFIESDATRFKKSKSKSKSKIVTDTEPETETEAEPEFRIKNTTDTEPETDVDVETDSENKRDKSHLTFCVNLLNSIHPQSMRGLESLICADVITNDDTSTIPFHGLLQTLHFAYQNRFPLVITNEHIQLLLLHAFVQIRNHYKFLLSSSKSAYELVAQIDTLITKLSTLFITRGESMIKKEDEKEDEKQSQGENAKREKPKESEETKKSDESKESKETNKKIQELKYDRWIRPIKESQVHYPPACLDEDGWITERERSRPGFTQITIGGTNQQWLILHSLIEINATRLNKLLENNNKDLQQWMSIVTRLLKHLSEVKREKDSVINDRFFWNRMFYTQPGLEQVTVYGWITAFFPFFYSSPMTVSVTPSMAGPLKIYRQTCRNEPPSFVYGHLAKNNDSDSIATMPMETLFKLIPGRYASTFPSGLYVLSNQVFGFTGIDESIYLNSSTTETNTNVVVECRIKGTHGSLLNPQREPMVPF